MSHAPEPASASPPVKIDWGSVPEWVEALATVGAFFAAAIALAFTVRAVRYAAESNRHSADANAITAAAYEADVRQRREAQARFVYTTIRVMNEVRPGIRFGSLANTIIDPEVAKPTGAGDWIGLKVGLVVEVALHNESDELIAPFAVKLLDTATGDDIRNYTFIVRDPLLPKDTRLQYFGVVLPLGEGYRLRGDVIFKDSSGTVWRRRGSEPIELYADALPW